VHRKALLAAQNIRPWFKLCQKDCEDNLPQVYAEVKKSVQRKTRGK